MSGRPALLAAFASIYLIWGSTYLVIAWAIETVPPFAMAGTRFFVAGVGLYLFERWRGHPRPRWQDWRAASVLGVLMLCGGNGMVTWAEQRVASSVAALLITTVPLWMVMIDAVWRGRRPDGLVIAGVVFGFVGVFVLVDPLGRDVSAIDAIGAVALIAAAFSWAMGSVRSQHVKIESRPFMVAAMEMIAGGLALWLLATLRGEWAHLDVSAISAKSLVSMAYLVVFGSIVALSAYVWLLQVTTPAAVGTYAFVNPIVAVILGWMLANEQPTPRMAVAGTLIVGAVVLIHWARYRSRARAAAELACVAAES